MTSVLYDQSSLLITAVLFVALVLSIEAGYRLARRRQASIEKSARKHISSMRSSMLTLLALQLGFTFAQSLARYDARSEAVVDEANAIGTAYLRERTT